MSGARPGWARRVAVCLACPSLLAVAVLLAVVAAADGVTYLALLAGVGTAAAAGASSQVRHDDVLGWLGAAAVAAPVALLTVAAHTSGLPAMRAVAWSAGSIALVTLSSTTMVAGLVAFVLPRPAAERTTDGRSRP